MQNLHHPASAISISTNNGLFFFRAEEIIRLEASSNYTCIYFTNRPPMLMARILGAYEEILSGVGFVRTHRSHLVNKNHVRFIDGAGNIIMQDTSRAEISRRKKKEVMKALRDCSLYKELAA